MLALSSEEQGKLLHEVNVITGTLHEVMKSDNIEGFWFALKLATERGDVLRGWLEARSTGKPATLGEVFDGDEYNRDRSGRS